VKIIHQNKFRTERIFTLKRLSIVLGIPIEILRTFSICSVDHYHPYIKTINHKQREIANPSKALKEIQERIVERILCQVPLPEEIFGGVKGKDIRKNAMIHRGQPTVVTIDLKDCFPSISFKDVYRLFREDFGYSKEVSGSLTQLTTFKRSLPQGGVASTALVNILLTPLCKRIRVIIPEENKLTLWVDDITFSGKDAQLYCQDIVHEAQMFGFRTRSRKVKVMFNNKPQLVTGTIVNRKVSVPKEKIEKYLEDYRRKINSSESTTGRVNHVSFINPTQGRRLKKRLKTRLIP